MNVVLFISDAPRWDHLPEDVDGVDVFDSNGLPEFGATYHVSEKRVMGFDF